MNSFIETASHENPFTTTDGREMNDSILNQMLKLDGSHISKTEGSTLLTEDISHLEPLKDDGSPKLLLAGHEGIGYRLGKLDIVNGNMDQQFFDCTSIPVSNAMLSGIPEHASFSHLTESPTNSDSPISPLSIQSRNDGLSLPWDNVQGFPAFTNMMSQTPVYQYTSYDPQSLMSRRASLPDNDIAHFTQFPDTTIGRKRVVSWADVETNSIGAKNLDQNHGHASQQSHTRRFSLHLPIQSNNINPHIQSKPYYPANVYPADCTMSDSLQKLPVNVNSNERNQLNFPIVYEPLPKPKSPPFQDKHVTKSKPKEQRNLKVNENMQSKSGETFDELDEYSDSNIDTKDYDQEEKQSNKNPHQAVVERRLSRRRERNRLAARRSREKRNLFLRDLEQINQALSSENGALKASLCEAMQELQMLRAATSASNTNTSTSSVND
ncbi:hypothetical protein K7432_000740 [Basidiobolus ranarum]|uniref:BZIP domain-containing protein n=1 Tax=Basidiobolus ranarum TaxID=34480 RepID=A0ABR2X466_9FUNG